MIDFPDFGDTTWNNILRVNSKDPNDNTKSLELYRAEKRKCIMHRYECSAKFGSIDFLDSKTNKDLEPSADGWPCIHTLLSLQVKEDDSVVDEMGPSKMPIVFRSGSAESIDHFNLIGNNGSVEASDTTGDGGFFTGRFITFFPGTNYHIEFYAGPITKTQYKDVPLKPSDHHFNKQKKIGTTVPAFVDALKKTSAPTFVKISDIWLTKHAQNVQTTNDKFSDIEEDTGSVLSTLPKPKKEGSVGKDDEDKVRAFREKIWNESDYDDNSDDDGEHKHEESSFDAIS